MEMALFGFSVQMGWVTVSAPFHLACQTSSQYYCNSQCNCVSAFSNACLPPEQGSVRTLDVTCEQYKGAKENEPLSCSLLSGESARGR